MQWHPQNQRCFWALPGSYEALTYGMVWEVLARHWQDGPREYLVHFSRKRRRGDVRIKQKELRVNDDEWGLISFPIPGLWPKYHNLGNPLDNDQIYIQFLQEGLTLHEPGVLIATTTWYHELSWTTSLSNLWSWGISLRKAFSNGTLWTLTKIGYHPRKVCS